jgi:hypothetical protein
MEKMDDVLDRSRKSPGPSADEICPVELHESGHAIGTRQVRMQDSGHAINKVKKFF